MDSRQIEILLEKYWACETNLEEEKQLKSFFAEEMVPEHLKMYIPFFLMQKGKANIQGGEHLLQNIENLPAKNQKRIFIKYFYPGMKVAASILIVAMVGLGIYTHHQNEMTFRQAYFDTGSNHNPEEMMEEVHQAFYKIGASFARAQYVLDDLSDTTQVNIME